MHLYLSLDGGGIRQARFQAFGCAPSVAAGSVLTEMLCGMDLDTASGITPGQIDAALGGLPPLKNHCATLAVDALKAALGAVAPQAT